MLPSFPYEITEKILKLGTLQLVYEERRHSKLVGQANAFLLSAALVSHTWRNIAQPLLTKHGLVDPFRALPFISELERQGVLSTLHAVRVGRRAGHDDSGWGPRSGPAYNLLGLIPMIAKITSMNHLEFVGRSVRFERGGNWTPASSRITSVAFTGYKGDAFVLLSDLSGCFHPTSLTFIESRDERFDYQYTPRTSDIRDWFKNATSLYIETAGPSIIIEVLVHQQAQLAKANLESIHLEASTVTSLSSLIIPGDPLDLADVAPLVELATHLPIFEDSADRFPPNLTTLKILRDVGKHHSELYISPEDTILSLLTTLSALKELEIPDCWRSDAVEEACEAKGVALTWSSTCE